jgi:hypothetical protein
MLFRINGALKRIALTAAAMETTHWRRSALGVLALAAVTACSERPLPTAPSPDASTYAGVPASTPEQLLARGLAQALGKPGVRLAVRDAMRASQVTEHKLVLQEFVGTPAGQALVDATATAMGTTVDAVLTTIRELPALDFYVPSRNSRRTWTGSANVALAIDLDTDLSRVTAFTPSGDPTVYDLAHPTAASNPGSVLFMLHRAEPKARRINPQSRRPDLVIQDENDGEESGVLEIHRPGAPVQRVEFADLADGSLAPSFVLEPCETCGGGGGGGAPADTTFIRELNIRSVCDNDDCSQGNEFEFKASVFTTSDVRRLYYKASHYGIPSSGTRYNLVQMYDKLKSGDSHFTVDIIELDDGWGNDDDTFDPDPVVYFQHNSFHDSPIPTNKFFEAGDTRCAVANGADPDGYPNYWPPCPATIPNNFYTRELRMAFKWRDF